MYFWNIKKLKQDLINNQVTESDIFKYTLLSLVLITLGLEGIILWGGIVGELQIWDYCYPVASLTSIILGTFAIYRGNGGEHGVQFANRYISLIWVVGIRWLVLYFTLATIMILILDDGSEEIKTTGYDFSLYAIMITAFYWRVFTHIKDVASHDTTNLNIADAEIT